MIQAEPVMSLPSPIRTSPRGWPVTWTWMVRALPQDLNLDVRQRMSLLHVGRQNPQPCPCHGEQLREWCEHTEPRHGVLTRSPVGCPWGLPSTATPHSLAPALRNSTEWSVTPNGSLQQSCRSSVREGFSFCRKVWVGRREGGPHQPQTGGHFGSSYLPSSASQNKALSRGVGLYPHYLCTVCSLYYTSQILWDFQLRHQYVMRCHNLLITFNYFNSV